MWAEPLMTELKIIWKKKPVVHLRREEGARTIATVTIDVRAWAFHCFIPSCSGQIIAKFYLYCNRSCRQNLCSSFWADVWVGASWSLSLLKKHRSCLVRPVTRLSAVCLILDKLRKREKKIVQHPRASITHVHMDILVKATATPRPLKFFLKVSFSILVSGCFFPRTPPSLLHLLHKQAHTREHTHTGIILASVRAWNLCPLQWF